MDWTQTTETSVKYHQTDPDVDPTRKEKKRPTEKRPPGIYQEDEPYLEPDRKKNTGQMNLGVPC